MTLVPLAGAAVPGGGVGVAEWVAVAIFVGVYILIATERVHRVAAALGGAGLVLAFGIVDSQEPVYSQETGVDWDVIFLLLGMMLVVGAIRRTGTFEYLAIHSAKMAGGEPRALWNPYRIPTPGSIVSETSMSPSCPSVVTRVACQPVVLRRGPP